MDNIVNKKKMIPKPTSLGQNLKFLRRINGKCQRDIAEAIGLSRNNIASYESGMVEPNADNFLKIAVYFDIDPVQLLEDLLTENPLKPTKINDPQEDSVLMEKMNAFVQETNEMTKVLEGYKALMSIKKDTNEYKENLNLYRSLEELLDLLRSLVALNWDLIQSIIPSVQEDAKHI